MDSSSRRSTSAWRCSNGSRERDATFCRAALCRVRGRKRGRESESGGERRWWRGEGESSRCCHSSNQRYFSPLKRAVDPARRQKSFSTKASAGYFAPTMLERKEPSEVPTGSTPLLTVCLSSCDASVQVRRTQKGSSAPVIVNQLEVSHREQRVAEI